MLRGGEQPGSGQVSGISHGVDGEEKEGLEDLEDQCSGAENSLGVAKYEVCFSSTRKV